MAPEPETPDGGMPDDAVLVRWQVAREPGLNQVLRQGDTLALPELAHSVHVDLDGLEPDTEYWYRFSVVGHRGTRTIASRTGRTKTLPAPHSQPAHFRFASASCQHYEQGLFVAYDTMIEDDPNVVIHLGDYIYDVSFGASFRKHETKKSPQTLTDYRLRHARYKQDPHLRRAHANLPFLVVPDNHDALEFNDPSLWSKRAAAFQAWYEHLPVRASPRHLSAAMSIYSSIDVGDLMRLYLLDTRQFRDDQDICRDQANSEFGFGIFRPSCSGIDEEERSLLGAEQESWLTRTMSASKTRWNAVATTVPFAPFVLQDTGGLVSSPAVYWGSWSAYPKARDRLLDTIDRVSVTNPMFLSGDIHSSWVSEVLAPDGSRVVATELTTTSISSDWPAPLSDPVTRNLRHNPHVKLYEPSRRGYCLHDVRPEQWSSRFRTVSSVRIADPETIDIGPIDIEIKGR